MLGKPVGDFSLPSTGNTTFRLSGTRGSKVVLHFYSYAAFRKSKTQLLSDEDETVCKPFDVIQLKNTYGRKVRGIVRSTFVVDDQGVRAREWRGVKVPGHVQEVLNFVKAL
jgi:thioredoxin-dependent peroxiredoxin